MRKYIVNKIIIVLVVFVLGYFFWYTLLNFPRYSGAWTNTLSGLAVYLSESQIVVQIRDETFGEKYFTINPDSGEAKELNIAPENLSIASPTEVQSFSALPQVKVSDFLNHPIVAGYDLKPGTKMVIYGCEEHLCVGYNIGGNHEGYDYKFVYDVSGSEQKYLQRTKRKVAYD